MKLNKQISELVQSNFVAVEEANEGLLRGGFGEIGGREEQSTGLLNSCNKCNTNCPCPATTTTTTTTLEPIPTSVQFVL